MRPIILDMLGFASFRDEAHVDFSDADFFALVGPTGSGKSTVIDAMTFALYGSVPRWGRKGMVSLALAPSVARGTVKLVFEVDGQRYVVARELRRTASTVNQRAASLERLADPHGSAQPGDQTFPMAKDIDGVNAAVEKLLGLKYEDFIQCVVLPQGQFADFLHAKPSERQEILLRLLGAEHYRLMMMKANQRANVSEQRATTYGEELLGYADATAEAEKITRAAEVALVGLGERVTETLPLISARREELKAAEGKLQELRVQQAKLSALRVPDGVEKLDADLAAGGVELEHLKTAEQVAEDADTAARDELSRGPQRAPLELAEERRAEYARLQGGMPGLVAEVTKLGEQTERASAAVDSAAGSVDDSRTKRDEALRATQATAERVTVLTAEHSRFAAVSIPRGVAELDEQRSAATRAMKTALDALEKAEQADAAAREARAATAPEASLHQATRDLGELGTLLADVASAERAAQGAATALERAEGALAAAEEVRRQRQAELEEARRDHVVAGLRPHLVAGEPCPVCEQSVLTLPAPLEAHAVDAAQAHMADADNRVNAARAAVREADAIAANTNATLSARAERQTVLASHLISILSDQLADFPLPGVFAVADARAAINDDELARALVEIAALTQARLMAEQTAERATNEAQEARKRHRGALEREARAEAALTSARNALRTARDPLVELGAPQVDDANLSAGWTALAQWAQQQAQARAAALTEAQAAKEAAADQYRKLAAEFAEAERTLARLRVESKTASENDQRARAQLSQVSARISELDGLLEGAPNDEQITERLALLKRLETAADQAKTVLDAARQRRTAADKALAALREEEHKARSRLSVARDSVVGLGAPVLDGRGLLDAWMVLLTWGQDEAKVREQDAATAERAAELARASIVELTSQLSRDLANSGIELASGSVHEKAAAAVASALEGARARTSRIKERRAEAADLVQKQRTAQEDQQVAHMLGNLLQARQFPQWLVSEALDDLVTAASETLAALTNGQFDLTHDKGDLFVIDHADADAKRSVRTLSGGETFQASLALALALSSQISALATAGAARLDSIFLDEGFGTLDGETLEVVATTLETLAQGSRMVGVVTHVTALADRVPVRYRVTRNARTSIVAREGLAVVDEEELTA
jgi:DNA repair protein SbcC/Rad50